MAKIIVTGGAGFIGSNLVDRLIDDGHKVIVLDNLLSGKKKNLNKKATFHKIDVQNLKKIQSFFVGVDYVFHMAAMARIQPSIIDPAPTLKNNILGTLNVLLASKNAKVKKVIYSASSSFYGDQEKIPLTEDMRGYFKNPYSFSKYAGEELCRLFTNLYELPTVCLRYFNVYGKRQLAEGAYCTVVGVFIRQIKDGDPITIVGDGTLRRDFTNVEDVVEANVRAMKKGDGVMNVGTGVNYSINQVANIILNEFLGISLQRALTLGKAMYCPRRPGESKITLADITRIGAIFNWKPSIDFRTGIQKLK